MPLALIVGCLLVSQSAQAQSAADRLTAYLENSSFKIRLSAAIQIGKQKVSEAAPALIKALGDEHKAVRAAAALSLGQLGFDRHRKHLVKLLTATEALDRKAATKGLSLLDRSRGNPGYLLVVDKPTLGKGVSKSSGKSIYRRVGRTLSKSTKVTFSAGEEKILQGHALAKHLKSRKLKGMIIRPKLSKLSTSESGDSTTVSCKVSIMVVALLNNRMEFAGNGEADAEVGETGLDMDTIADIESQVLKASADAAVEEVLGYLARRKGP